MSTPSTVATPSWALDDTQARMCFLIRLAALYHNDTGSLTQLSEAIGLSKPALHVACKRGQIAPEHAVAIEKLIGRALFPRELFRPDLFLISAE